MRLVFAIGLAASLACQPQSNQRVADSAPASADTLRGILVLTGSDPYPIAAVRTSSGRVMLDGTSSRLLKLTGLEMWLRGSRTAEDRFRVVDYRVRAVNGDKAWDGTLRRVAAGLELQLEDGTIHPVRGGPSGFANLAGSRIWLTENPDGTIREYGVF